MRRWYFFCPVCTLHSYVVCTQDLFDQLFICFANVRKGKALPKQKAFPLDHGGYSPGIQRQGSQWLTVRGRIQTEIWRPPGLCLKGCLWGISSVARRSSPHSFVRLYCLDLAASSVDLCPPCWANDALACWGLSSVYTHPIQNVLHLVPLLLGIEIVAITLRFISSKTQKLLSNQNCPDPDADPRGS